MTVHIGRVRMRLPAGYRGRAENIARGVAQGVAGLRPSTTRALDTLTVGPVRVDAGASDAQIADAVMQQLRQQLESGT